MRLYSIFRWFRTKRLVLFLLILAFITLSFKTNIFFHYKSNLNYNILQNHLKYNKYFIFNSVYSNFEIGRFLKNKTQGNTSHCLFRYGEADSFNYTEEDLLMAPELGEKVPYRILYGVVEGNKYNMTNPDTITYVTHATLDFLNHIVEVIIRWEGVMSVAAFLPGTDAYIALQCLRMLCYCLQEMENVSVHFIFPTNHRPSNPADRPEFNTNSSSSTISVNSTSDTFENTSNSLPFLSISSTKSPDSCTLDRSLFTANSYRMKHKLVYPVNVARNAARFASKTKYQLVSDMELLPSAHLVPEFLKMIQRINDRSSRMGVHYFTKKRHVFVVPVFEVAEDVVRIPRTKTELLDLYQADKAVYFHRFICPHCQRFPGMQRWLQKNTNPRSSPLVIQPLVVVRREFPFHRWEPVFIGSGDEPLYSELLTWEGQQDKMTQMHEMCLQDYRFVILNNAFLVHTPGIKRKRYQYQQVTKSVKEPYEFVKSKHSNLTITSTSPPQFQNWRSQHMKRNAYLYQLITQDVADKYNNNPRCRTH